MFLATAPVTITDPASLLRRLAFIVLIRWLVPDRLRRTFPLPVILILFAKPLWVFCLGIFLIPFAYCSFFYASMASRVIYRSKLVRSTEKCRFCEKVHLSKSWYKSGYRYNLPFGRTIPVPVFAYPTVLFYLT